MIDVQALCAQLDLTPQGLADRLHVTKRTVLRWEAKITKPRGPARAALLHLQQSLQSASSSSGLRIGVCPEFTDTLLPVLAGMTGTLTRRLSQPISFVPIPWDSRALAGLHTGLLDAVLFNEHCAHGYANDTAYCLQFAGEAFESGPPYIAFSLPASVPSTDLLSVLWHPGTIKIVPHADMELTMRLVRAGCRRAGGELQVLAMHDDESGWFRCSAGLGVRLFLNPPSFWGNTPIAYIGGQDQRALIELAKEQTVGRMITILVEPAKGLDVELPDVLRTNRLVTLGRSVKWIGDVADAIGEARCLVTADETVRGYALTEIMRWRHSHGSAEGTEFSDTRRELRATLPRTRTYSAELGRWF